MSIITEVERIQQAKQDLKNKLLEKGVDVGDKKIDEYAPMLDEIQSGGENTLKKLFDYTKSTAGMFSGNKNIIDLTGYISYSDTENVTKMASMFTNCSSLTTIPLLDTSKVTSMYQMFYGCNKLTTIPQLDTSKVLNMNYMFYGCSSLTTIPQLDTSNVLNMNYMFYGCSSLTTIPQLDTSKVTSMYQMFNGCSSLTTIPLLDTYKVTSMDNMFNGCSSLTTIPQLDTSKVTSMYQMFYGCNKLTTIPQLDTSKVLNMDGMFYGCSSLTTIPLLDTYKVTSMYQMFYGCSSLTTIDISRYNISTTSKSSSWCYNCYSLKSLIIHSFGTSYALNSNAFNNCYHLLGTVDATYNPNGDKDCYIYVPRSMVDTLKSATNWSTYADQFRALEDYTIDGTTTGELDESKVNA